MVVYRWMLLGVTSVAASIGLVAYLRLDYYENPLLLKGSTPVVQMHILAHRKSIRNEKNDDSPSSSFVKGPIILETSHLNLPPRNFDPKQYSDICGPSPQFN